MRHAHSILSFAATACFCLFDTLRHFSTSPGRLAAHGPDAPQTAITRYHLFVSQMSTERKAGHPLYAMMHESSSTRFSDTTRLKHCPREALRIRVQPFGPL